MTGSERSANRGLRRVLCPAGTERSADTGMIVVRRAEPTPSSAYEIIWKFAAERHRAYLERLAGRAAPWTSDPVLRGYRFTNTFRAADRVSQALIGIVRSSAAEDPDTLFLRVLLFKTFNKIETWEAIVECCGIPDVNTFDVRRYDNLLARLRSRGTSIYSSAYIMPSAGSEGEPKHRGHLRLIRKMLDDGVPQKVQESASLQSTYELLLQYRSIGRFLGFQYAIDLNYSALTAHEEADFVVAGPGAIDGLSKCFVSLGDYSPEDAVHWLAERQEEEFRRLGLEPATLWGRRLQPIDVQNVLCEVSKYTRVARPDILGVGGRTRIKHRFSPAGPLPAPMFPVRWGLDNAVRASLTSGPLSDGHLPARLGVPHCSAAEVKRDSTSTVVT